jgi:two-component system CheB/CheR fusion protein
MNKNIPSAPGGANPEKRKDLRIRAEEALKTKAAEEALKTKAAEEALKTKAAEEALKTKAAKNTLKNKADEIEKLSSEDLKYLVHELSVHQIELEMQNEELKEARIQLEVSLNKFSDLYNFAPIAYFTLDPTGQIDDINLSGMNMLSQEKRYLQNKHFQNFILQEYKDRFHSFLSRVFSTKSKQTCELEIINKKDQKYHIQLIGTPIKDVKKDVLFCRTAMIDITDQKMAREIIKASIEEKERLNIILKTQEQERKRISESLHNGIGQTLYAAKLKLDQFIKDASKSDNLMDLKTLLAEAINDVKVISFELIPAILEDFGLETILQELCRKFSKDDGIKFSCTVFGYKKRMDVSVEIAIYRIIQELVNNILKHSQAKDAQIYLTVTDKIIIRVEDNGIGFSEPEAIKKTEGMGLKNIKNRVKLLDGTMEFISGAKKGTTVIINVPLSK